MAPVQEQNETAQGSELIDCPGVKTEMEEISGQLQQNDQFLDRAKTSADQFMFKEDEIKASQSGTGNELECLICGNTYKDPRLLHCMHTFCNGCIEQLRREGEQQNIVVCPQCGFLSKAVTDGRLVFWRNHLIHQKVKWSEISSLRDSNALQCCNCETETTTKICMDCQLKFCDTCTAHHQHTKRFKDHNIQTIESVSNEDILETETIKCSEHGFEIRYWCQTCNLMTCVDCVSCKYHEGHAFLSLSKVMDNRIESLDLSLEQAPVVYAEYKAHLMKLEEFFDRSVTERNSSRKHVEDVFTELNKTLQDEKQKILQWLDLKCELSEKALKVAKEKVNHVKIMAGYLKEISCYSKDEVLDVLKIGVPVLKDNIESMKSAPKKARGKDNDFDLEVSAHCIKTKAASETESSLKEIRLTGGLSFEESFFPVVVPGLVQFEFNEVSKISEGEGRLSTPVKTGNLSWRIKLHRSSRSSSWEIHVCCEWKGNDLPWQCRAQTDVTLKNENGNNVTKSDTYTWSNRVPHLIFHGSLSWEKLIDENEGFVKNDMVTIVARIHIQMHSSGSMDVSNIV